METNTVIIERTLQLPVNVVWKAFSNAENQKKWWGPNDFTCPYFKSDFIVGGKYLGAMEDKKGNKTWGTGYYVEIIPEKRIVMTDSFSDEKGNIISGTSIGMPGKWPDVLLVTIEFQQHEDTTLLLLNHEGIPPESHDDCVKGWQECFDKLENVFRYFRETSNSLDE